jgi:Leucine-rich repeat (LRR) protein
LLFSETLPQEIGNLKKLETLSLDNNLLRQLPGTFLNLKHLRTVNLSGNGFKTFPQELCDLTHLDAIDLSKNRITEIQPNSKTCHTIELNLNQNQVCYKFLYYVHSLDYLGVVYYNI